MREGLRRWLPGALAELAREHRVPGAAVAVLAGDELAQAAYGVLSKATGVEATTDSVFQIGSVTKPWTATLVMQLVDEEAVDLDAPVRRYLPEFRVADEQASAEITVRHLICHVAGFEGDIFTDTGRGDDAIEKYLATITDVPQLFRPGERFSYNNAAYVVLGRIVEVLRGKPYAAAVRDHLFVPLGLSHAATDAYEAILHRAAVGHVTTEPGADPRPAAIWAAPSSTAPAGTLLAMSAADLVRFAEAHLCDGGEVLSSGAAAAMRQPQVTLPDLGVTSRAWGMGWTLYAWGGDTVVGHDGGVIGQEAFLRMVPDAKVAVALLTNGGDAFPLYRELVGETLQDLAGVRLPAPPVPPADPLPLDPGRYTGRYESGLESHEVTVDGDGRLWLSMTPRGVAAEAMSPDRYEIVRRDGDSFLSAERRAGSHLPVAFLDADAGGRARFLYQGRALPRVPDAR